jgi:membrane carboxypeptidase/penicillin-binding protein
MDFMEAYVGDREEKPAFDPPTNIVFVSVDPETGEPAGPGTFRPIEEAFIAGTEPGTAFLR